jgi:hypothetical protein
MPSAVPQKFWRPLTLLILPVLTAAIALTLRESAGPFWVWSNLDPDYFYLFDALHLVIGEPPGHIPHPGVPVDMLGALVLRLAHLGDASARILDLSLADPETQLAAISTAIVLAIALAAWVLGIVAFHATGSLVFTLFLQSAPLLSALIQKNAFHPKPEAVLVIAISALMAVAAAALRPGAIEERRSRFAIAFGIVAGFTMATKVTAVPVLALPLFLLATPAAIGIYALTALLAAVVFTIPAIPVYPMIGEWLGRVALGSGTYGQGPETIVNWTVYPGEILRMLRRPPLTVGVPAGLIGLALVAWRSRAGSPLPSADVRLLAGTVLGQVLEAAMVAKQPGGQYMIPSYLLAALTYGLLYRMSFAFTGSPAVRRAMPVIGLCIVAGFVAGGLFSAGKLHAELGDLRSRALALDNNRFAACGRIYYYSASSPTFALFLAEHTTSSGILDDKRWRPGFAAKLSALTPKNDFWLDDWSSPGRFTLQDWSGVRAPAEVAAAYPCLMVRGEQGRTPGVIRYLTEAFPGVAFDRACSTRDEPVFTSRVDCDGQPR